MASIAAGAPNLVPGTWRTHRIFASIRTPRHRRVPVPSLHQPMASIAPGDSKSVPGTNGTVRLGSARKFSSGTWKIFVILPRALTIDDDFKNLPWLKSRTFLASAN